MANEGRGQERFAFEANLARSGRAAGLVAQAWPPGGPPRLVPLRLDEEIPPLPGLANELDTLARLVEQSCASAAHDESPATRMPGAPAVADCLRRIAELLPRAADRQHLLLRAAALEQGYDESSLLALAAGTEEIAVVAGLISTWFGKSRERAPTAFGCRADVAQQRLVDRARELEPQMESYLRDLHADLRLEAIPSFAPTRLFMMAGEGACHPKHIAYFLPEDEGVKGSPFKKTYYFGNVHRALIEAVAVPKSERHLNLGIGSAHAASDGIPTLGVFAHEIGHAVVRPATSYKRLNAADRLASVMLQELAADVFGTLLLADVIAPVFGLGRGQALAYHLGECLRYVDRGLGCYPDSDGMFLQLAYLAHFGALEVEGDAPLLVGDPDVILAGFRSLGRVLADTLLATDEERALALYRSFGPAAGTGLLTPLVEALSREPPASLDYVAGTPAAAPVSTAAIRVGAA